MWISATPLSRTFLRARSAASADGNLRKTAGLPKSANWAHASSRSAASEVSQTSHRRRGRISSAQRRKTSASNPPETEKNSQASPAVSLDKEGSRQKNAPKETRASVAALAAKKQNNQRPSTGVKSNDVLRSRCQSSNAHTTTLLRAQAAYADKCG